MYVGSPVSFTNLSIQTNKFGCKMSFYFKTKMCRGIYLGSPDLQKKKETVKKQLSHKAVKNKQTDGKGM